MTVSINKKMKTNRNTVLLVVMLIMSATMMAQSNGIDRYYETYKQDDRFTRISVSGKMFSLFANFEMDDPTEQEALETISKIKGLKMLVGDAIPEAKSIYVQAVKRPNAEMEELMTVENKTQEFKFFITEANGTISELLMLMYDGQSIMMMSLVGDIDLKSISKLSEKMDIQGFEHLENVDKK